MIIETKIEFFDIYNQLIIKDLLQSLRKSLKAKNKLANSHTKMCDGTSNYWKNEHRLEVLSSDIEKTIKQLKKLDDVVWWSTLLTNVQYSELNKFSEEIEYYKKWR